MPYRNKKAILRYGILFKVGMEFFSELGPVQPGRVWSTAGPAEDLRLSLTSIDPLQHNLNKNF